MGRAIIEHQGYFSPHEGEVILVDNNMGCIMEWKTNMEWTNIGRIRIISSRSARLGNLIIDLYSLFPIHNIIMTHHRLLLPLWGYCVGNV